MLEKNEALGRAIKARRRSMGMSQEELGSRVGYGGGAGVSISNIERGLTRPSGDRLTRIAEELGTTPDDLRRDARAQSNQPRAARQGRDLTATKRELQTLESELRAEARAHLEEIVGLLDDYYESLDHATEGFLVEFYRVAAAIRNVPDWPEQAEPILDSDSATLQASSRLEVIRAEILKSLASAAHPEGPPSDSQEKERGVIAIGLATRTAGQAAAALAEAPLALGMGLGSGLLRFNKTLLAGAGLAGAAVGVWSAVRSAKQVEELQRAIKDLKGEVAVLARYRETATRLIPPATDLLRYIGVHASHAVTRWESALPTTREWASLTAPLIDRYDDFVTVASRLLAIKAIEFERIIADEAGLEGPLTLLAEELIAQSIDSVQAVV